MSTTRWGTVLLAAVAASGAALGDDPAACLAAAGAVQHAAPFAVPGEPSPAHRRLFTPRAAPPGAYLVTVLPPPSATARDTVRDALGVVPPDEADGVATAAGSWAIRRLEVNDAFGSSGTYEPIRVARLFNGRRAEVSRGPVVRDGRVVASVTLISPYPDPGLTRLEPGTLVIVFVIRPPARLP